MSTSLSQFIESLSASGVLSVLEMETFFQSLGDTSGYDAKSLAQEFVRRGVLTPFQARKLYRGVTKGLVLGSYTILDKIGAGGMGHVFKAHHRLMKRVVALKVISASKIQSPDHIQRFFREVETAARLHHPNIVTAFDAAEVEGIYYLVMEFVDGFDLATLVKRHGRVPVAMAVDWVRQAARGLEYAHQMGVVHRDIKPGNLLLNTHHTIKILDMGLARLTGHNEVQHDELTRVGEIVGTIEFMAPEQAEDTRLADARADVYSLGCTLYCLLAGEFVYPANTMMRKLLAHRQNPIPSLAAKRDDVPAGLDAVFAKMVAKKPKDRFQTMSEVIEALDRCKDSIYQLSRRVSKLDQLQHAGNDAKKKPAIHAKTTHLSDNRKTAEDLELDFDVDSEVLKAHACDPGNNDSEVEAPAAPAPNPAASKPPPRTSEPELADPSTMRTARQSIVPKATQPAAAVSAPDRFVVVRCLCGTLFSAPASQAGKRATCSACHSELPLPELGPPGVSSYMVEGACDCGRVYLGTRAVAGRTIKCSVCQAKIPLRIPQPIVVACGCGRRFQAEPYLAGQIVSCPNCRSPLAIPSRK